MLIAIDHGNYAVKTPRFSFVSGLAEHTVRPPMSEEIMEYGGKFWTLTTRRLPNCKRGTKDGILLLSRRLRRLFENRNAPILKRVYYLCGTRPRTTAISS